MAHALLSEHTFCILKPVQVCAGMLILVLVFKQVCMPLQVAIPELDMALPAYYVLAISEASSNLARYDGVRYGLQQPVRSLCYLFGRCQTNLARCLQLALQLKRLAGAGLGDASQYVP